MALVYKVDSSGNQTVIYAFTGGSDGAYPEAPVTRDSAGNLYGATIAGGTGGHGIVYRVDRSGNETVLYRFSGGADGDGPSFSGVVRDSDGNLYGTTYMGGNGFGVVYRIDANGAETVLHAFAHSGTGGYGPTHGVTLDSAGNIFGTTVYGGVNGFGVVYKLGSGGQGTTLLSFSGPDGLYPAGGVILR